MCVPHTHRQTFFKLVGGNIDELLPVALKCVDVSALTGGNDQDIGVMTVCVDQRVTIVTDDRRVSVTEKAPDTSWRGGDGSEFWLTDSGSDNTMTLVTRGCKHTSDDWVEAVESNIKIVKTKVESISPGSHVNTF